MKARFQGKTVIITGASSGVGEACAQLFAGEGANVVLVARSRDKLKQVAARLPSAAIVAVDVGNPSNFTRVFKEATKRFGAIHYFVNNAGVNHRGNVEQVSEEQIAAIIELNLKSPLVLSRMALPHIRAAGGGAIVNVASLAGRVPLPHEASYSASKFGLRAFSLALHQELAGSGITCSVVSPGPIETGFILNDPESVPPLVFSQPMSTARGVAELVLQCAHDGKPERTIPKSGGFLTTVAYLFPVLRRILEPALERKGRRIRQGYIDRLNKRG